MLEVCESEVVVFRRMGWTDVIKSEILLDQLKDDLYEAYSVLSPCFRVDVVSVHVVHQAVLVVAKRLVSPVDKHAAAGLIVHAAVAVTPLDHRTSSRHNLPRVRP